MIDFDHAREVMVSRHIMRRGIDGEGLLEALRSVKREAFVPEAMQEFAYDDAPLPIGNEQTISQPFIVALMIDAAGIEPGDKVLEIGAGSGYAAAVMGRMARSVVAIERDAMLAREASERLARLLIDNVRIVEGDGTRGCEEEAPFDAIVVSAGGNTAPESLKRQLKVGGCLIIPVGDDRDDQRLLRITRMSETEFEEVGLGRVRFVPLIGEFGWPESGSEPKEKPRSIPAMIASAAEELPELDDPGFAAFADRFGDRKVVLLGEASHGTSEFYRARAAITQRLIERHGFTIVAVEADWPDAMAVNRTIRQGHRVAAEPASSPFSRFPQWMWRNTDVAEFIQWLRVHNERVENAEHQAGFYGLDMYSLGASIEAVLAHLDATDPKAAAVARERYGCLTPWQRDPASYGRMALRQGYASCEEAVVAQCKALLERQVKAAEDEREPDLDAVQNARLVVAAERYYRIMYYGGAASWNLRDQHMFDTLEHILDARGEDAKAVVWAHNSHIGDARETEMGRLREELNIGQLCRERLGREAALIGMGTHGGTVAAATEWGGDMEIKTVRPSDADSFEQLFHQSGRERAFVDFSEDSELAERLSEPRLERFIGVIYRPETELRSHYAQASLAKQFDAYLWFDETRAVEPLPALPVRKDEAEDTYPSGL